MQRLNVKLLLAFNEAHDGAGRSFSDSLGIAMVVLLGLDVRAHILRRQQPNLVPNAASHRPV